MCGEQAYDISYADVYDGPSPRVRGAGRAALTVGRAVGAIPACAGSRGGDQAGGA
ncbi:hypothetical protein STXM2123_5081 [Streptomyces sp. F-3]|nr:hypothetical protein STXM2123_5081 [Streptomyces sp. F-3]